MQNKKNYLIITIWVSTIAFVGAGFVGWGSYDYSKKDTVLGTVGELEVSVEDFNIAYSNAYNTLRGSTQDFKDSPMAKNLALNLARSNIINLNLQLNLAKNYDFLPLKEDISKNIFETQYFQKNGKFSKELYKQTVSSWGITPTTYENSLKKQIQLDKLNSALQVKANDLEVKSIASILQISDKIEYKVFDDEEIKVQIDGDELKNYWQKNKKSYLTETKYVIELIEDKFSTKTFSEKELQKYYDDNVFKFKEKEGKLIAFNDAKEKINLELNKEETRKQALKTYLNFKKSLIVGDIVKKHELEYFNNVLNKNIMTKISLLKVGEFLKPELNKEEYVNIKLLKILKPEPKSFELAKDEAKVDLLALKKEKALKEKAQKSLKDGFVGIKTDFIRRDSADIKLEGLSQVEVLDFISYLFELEAKKQDLYETDGKVVIFKILDQKISFNENNDTNLQDGTTALKQNMFSKNILSTLEKTFEVDIQEVNVDGK